MLRFLSGRISVRKLRLFGLECCKRAWPDRRDEFERKSLEVADRLGGDPATWEQISMSVALFAARALAHGECGNHPGTPWWEDADRVLADLLRDIVGNPFRTPAVDESWLRWNDNLVVKLATVIRNESSFERMPILADALEDAGCTDAEILDHCRQATEHVRGCWLLDLVLATQ
jgi:hypothetical protein